MKPADVFNCQNKVEKKGEGREKKKITAGSETHEASSLRVCLARLKDTQ